MKFDNSGNTSPMFDVMKKNFAGISDEDARNMAWSSSVTGGYSLGQDSLEQPGVPKGKLIDFDFTSREIYPDSFHACKLYLPAGYDPNVAYPFTVYLDGVTQYLSALVQANVAMDNLIHAGRIPAMIGIFLDPGDHGEGMPIWGGSYEAPNSNRSREYDSIDDTFVRFLTEELFPEIETRYRLSHEPANCICGASSGAQAAFNAAWHRPDVFRKVISSIGSYIAMRGGDCNPTRVRQTPRKPIRIFLHDGEADANIIYGDLVLANKMMASAFEYRGYDYKYVLGKGGHNFVHIGAILPEALEWIWR